MRARVAILIALLAAGCSSRERANPFDPANQVTSGRPSGFVAVAGNQRVDLRWDPVPIGTGLVGFQLFRRVGGAGEFDALSSVLPPTDIRYSDLGLANGVDHEYRIYFVFDAGLGQLPAQDIATPGTIRPWVVDYLHGTLNMLSPDGREIATRVGGFRGPFAVSADTTRGLVWFSEYDAGLVRVYDPATRVMVSIPGTRPSSIAVQQADGSAWVCDEFTRDVFHFDPDGQVSGPSIEGLGDPIGVATNGSDRSVWVCDNLNNIVRHATETAGVLTNFAVTKPSRVAVDAATGEAWVTSFTGDAVHRLRPSNGQVDSYGGFDGPIGIACDDLRRRVWVADAFGGRVLALRMADGTVAFSVPVATASDVAVDRLTGEAWVVTREAGVVLRISDTGAVIQRMTALQVPYGIALD